MNMNMIITLICDGQFATKVPPSFVDDLLLVQQESPSGQKE